MRGAGASRALLLCALAACSGKSDPGARSAEPTESATPSAEVSARAEAPALPDSFADLTALVPADASVVVGVPALDGLRANMDPAMAKLLIDGAAEALAGKLGVPKALVDETVAAYGGAVVFMVGAPTDKVSGAVIVRLKDASLLPRLAEAAKLKEIDKDHFSDGAMEAQWLGKQSLLLIASDKAALGRALAAAGGTVESFQKSKLHRPRKPGDLWVAADLATATGGKLAKNMAPGSNVVASIDFTSGLEVEYTQLGEQVPRVGDVLAPSAQRAVAELPSGAVVAWGMSLKRKPQRTLADVLNELGRVDGKLSTASEVNEALTQATKVTLSELDAALGDEAAMGAYHTSGASLTPGDFTKSGALLVTVATKNDAVAAKLIDAIAKNAPSSAKVSAKPGAFSFSDGPTAVSVQSFPGKVAIAVGESSLSKKLMQSSNQTSDRLGAQPMFAGRNTAPPEAHSLLVADFGSLQKLLPQEAGPAPSLGTAVGFFALSFDPNDKGVALKFKGTGGAGAVAGMGSLAAVGIYGVRRYLAAAKTAEAKNAIGAISRGAIAAYERESSSTPAHALCKSARPVPATVPAGSKYQPSTQQGQDFDTGSPTVGWKCLKFTITNPHYFQYDYRAGGNYKGPKRGGPDPGPDGFEASAEGDLDGDGKTSLFTLTGKVTPQGTVRLSTEIFIVDEHE